MVFKNEVKNTMARTVFEVCILYSQIIAARKHIWRCGASLHSSPQPRRPCLFTACKTSMSMISVKFCYLKYVICIYIASSKMTQTFKCGIPKLGCLGKLLALLGLKNSHSNTSPLGTYFHQVLLAQSLWKNVWLCNYVRTTQETWQIQTFGIQK